MNNGDMPSGMAGLIEVDAPKGGDWTGINANAAKQALLEADQLLKELEK